MHGVLTFHPVDLTFFDELVRPLVLGTKVNPEQFLAAAIKLRRTAWTAAGYVRALETLLVAAVPPPPPADGSLWVRIRTRLEEFDHRPDRASILALRSVEPDLHLYGRPFLVAEGSAERVAAVVDAYVEAEGTRQAESLIQEQLSRLHPELASRVSPAELRAPSADLAYRSELLAALRDLHGLAQTARRGESGNGGAESPGELLAQELPWRAVRLHDQAVPSWTARNVDGLVTVCLAAGIEPPEVLVPAWRLFVEACDEYAELREALGLEVEGPRQLGAFVAPDDVGQLLAFLTTEGARIIQAATRAGEGPACTVFLRKVRECACYAEQRGMGYLEASGIRPEDADADPS